MSGVRTWIPLRAVIQELGRGNKGAKRSSLSGWPVARDLKEEREARMSGEEHSRQREQPV